MSQSKMIPVPRAALEDVIVGPELAPEETDPVLREFNARGDAARDEALRIARTWWDAYQKRQGSTAGAEDLALFLATLPRNVLLTVASECIFQLAATEHSLSASQRNAMAATMERLRLQRAMQQKDEQATTRARSLALHRHASNIAAKEKLRELWENREPGRWDSKKDCVDDLLEKLQIEFDIEKLQHETAYGWLTRSDKPIARRKMGGSK